MYAVISNALDRALVAPNKIEVRNAPDNHHVDYPAAVGIMTCTVLRCRSSVTQ